MVVGNKGVIVGMSSVVESPIDFNLAGIYTVLSMSDDATVFAGGKYCSSAWGDAFLCPAVVVLDESPIVEEELEEEAEEPSDEELNEDEPSDEEEVEDGINYTYSSANGPAREYYNLAGQRVTAGYKGLIINNGRKVLKY